LNFAKACLCGQKLTAGKSSAFNMGQAMEDGSNPVVQFPDRRPTLRQRVSFPGLIVHANGAQTCDCMFRNLSTGGACIVKMHLLQIPDRFYLINIRDGIAYQARVVWNKGRQFGVSFEAAVPLAANTDPAFHRLKQLWLARTPR
jgi:hypothetical protein